MHGAPAPVSPTTSTPSPRGRRTDGAVARERAQEVGAPRLRLVRQLRAHVCNVLGRRGRGRARAEDAPEAAVFERLAQVLARRVPRGEGRHLALEELAHALVDVAVQRVNVRVERGARARRVFPRELVVVVVRGRRIRARRMGRRARATLYPFGQKRFEAAAPPLGRGTRRHHERRRRPRRGRARHRDNPMAGKMKDGGWRARATQA